MTKFAGFGGSTPGPQHAAPRIRTNRPRGVVVSAVVVVLGVVAVGGFVLINGWSAAAPDPASAAAPSTASAEPTPVPVPAAYVPPATTAAPAPTMADGPSPDLLPSTGPGVTEPGILLVALPAADGSFDVVERVRLLSAVDVLELRPAPVELAGRQFESATGTATAVQLSAGDQPVVVPGATVDAAVSLPVPAAAGFDLRYRLTDVSVRSVPSTAGRALAALGPLTVGVGDELPVHVVASGESILGVNCPLLVFAEQACGSRSSAGTGIETELPAGVALTTVQFDLPVS